jgi:predicted enzyme related to lactoylglutathione lyase
MQRVLGIGGVFFKASDPKALGAWYAKHLGVPVDDSFGGAMFSGEGQTVWSPFAADTKYFAPSEKPFMFNFRVTDLRAMLAQLREAGVTVDDKIEDSEFGAFGWFMDPEGNRVELWQPPA